jgi:hypothetical protein
MNAGQNRPLNQFRFIASTTSISKKIADSFRNFPELEASSGILHVIAAVVAMVVANSPLA